MEPIRFKESNLTLKSPPRLNAGDLPVYRGEGIIMSCWNLSFGERIKALVFGRIWLQVKANDTHVPVSLICSKSGFLKGSGK